MITHTPNVDRLRIATPCPIDWEQMTGDSRVRFCDHCQLNVYNISELSRSEAEALVAATEGRLCARLYWRADGTVLTKDCPVGLRALRLRVSKRAAAVFAAIAGISSLVFSQQSSVKKTECTPQTRITRTNAPANPAAKILTGTLIDPAGGAISGANVTVTAAATKEVSTTSTNDEGRFEFASLPPGSYSIKAEVFGFNPLQVRDVIIETDKRTNIDITLKPSGVTIMVGAVGTPDPFDTPPGTTIISEDIIRRLPIQK